MSTANDSDCEVEPILRAAVNVNIGYVNVIAILEESCPFNAVHSAVFKRIREEEDEDDDQTYEHSIIELDMSIDNHSVTVVFRVVPNLWTDMILGEDFFNSVAAHVHLGLRLFKWSCGEELVITKMVENYDNFRAISGGSSSCACNGIKLPEKEEIESKASQEPSTSKQKRNRKKKKEFEKTDSSTSSDFIDLQLQQPTLNRNDSSKKNLKKDEFVRIFIAEQNSKCMEMVDGKLQVKIVGECRAFYGIYSSQVNISLVRNEILDTKKKNPLGYHMEAFNDAFDEAHKHGVTRLHILSENRDAVKLMIAHQKKYEEDGDMEPEKYPHVCGLQRPNDFINYYSACLSIPGFKSLKFEYVPVDDKRYKEMNRARNLVDMDIICKLSTIVN